MHETGTNMHLSMTLDDAVNLVLYAFEYGQNGDIFVQKSPACTIETLAKGLISIFNSDVPIKYIGTGESIDDIQLFNKVEFVESFFQKNS